MYSFLEKNKVLLVYFPLAAYWLVLFLATTLPGSAVPDVKISDKLQHFGAYMILGLFMCLSYSFQQKIRIFRLKPFLYAIITIIIYAGLDEIHQYFIPGRSCDVLDLIADVSGALLGIGIVFLIKYFSPDTDSGSARGPSSR